MSRGGAGRAPGGSAGGVQTAAPTGPGALRRRRPGRVLYLVAFVVLLLDGVGAVWLGQIGRRPALLALGVCLVLGSLGVGLLYRRWQAALDEVDRARRALKDEVEALRRAVQDAPRSGGGGAKGGNGGEGRRG